MGEQHLLFYDGTCGFCDHTVQFLLNVDKEKKFLFAPLQGETAAQALKELPDSVKQADSLILIEDYGGENPKIYLYGKGVFRICWLLGGWWKLIGWLHFLPAFLYDWAYRLFAKYRYKLFGHSVCQLPDQHQRDRFLM